MEIAFVINNLEFLFSHRIDICTRCVDLGYRVHVIGPYKAELVEQLKELGIVFHHVNFSRGGKNPFIEFLSMVGLYKILKKTKPDMVHLITIKPYLYGGVVAKLLDIESLVASVAGLGIVFSSNSIKYILLRKILHPFYKLAFSHDNQTVIFQNKDDKQNLLDFGVVSNDKCIIIRGSGVDLNLFQNTIEKDNKPVIVSMASRLLLDKGVKVFVDASKILKQKKVNVEFWLIGSPDFGNSNSVSNRQLSKWSSQGLIKLLGSRDDIAVLFSKSNIVVLPSFYGEGLPKVLIEAAACGRAVITTDHPGCRDAIEPKKSGLLIPVNNCSELANSIEYLANNKQVREDMGKAGRLLAEGEFSVVTVVDTHIDLYKALLKNTYDVKFF